MQKTESQSLSSLSVSQSLRLVSDDHQMVKKSKVKSVFIPGESVTNRFIITNLVKHSVNAFALP